ncbi:two-component sensor histidine kinase [Paenibacillus selenitireducens]|uniref:histidine kinase n=1 Tax=Paenibacillus selenitireducens TaxID=1324314 RepID=A0A1T2X9V7_9BACL|nr:HAMP domain-containing sensor histidine kinase [Paenibacillus selenitireducens]OPA76689.1 two-component sensor histidine kinase [Paenibacillus selenitireducens]
MSIRLRLTAWYASILALTFLIVGFAIYGFAANNIYGGLRERISKQVNQINIVVNYNFLDGVDLNVDRGIGDEEIYIQFVNYQNGAIKGTPNLGKMQFPYPASSKDIKEGFKHVNVNGFPFYVYESAIKVRGKVIGFATFGVFTGKEVDFFNQLKNILTLVSITMVIIASTIGLFIARKALRPIENVIRAANQIQHGADLSVRIQREGPNDEIGQLTDTVNGMLSRMEIFYRELDESYRAQRRFVSDASHELRTPLTTIRGNVDLLEKMWSDATEQDKPHWDEKMKREMSLEALQDIAGESRRMSRLVNDLLALARADAGVIMEKEPLQLKPLMEEVIRRAQFLPRTADWITGDISILDDIVVNGHKEYLQQMLFIFIENAFKYTPEGSVTIEAVVHDQQVGIRIVDTGIGMDREQVPHIFDRFYRADESRGITAGTGLGLSIAKWIIDEHYGSVEVITAVEKGAAFIIWLPIVNAFPTNLE